MTQLDQLKAKIVEKVPDAARCTSSAVLCTAFGCTNETHRRRLMLDDVLKSINRNHSPGGVWAIAASGMFFRYTGSQQIEPAPFWDLYKNSLDDQPPETIAFLLEVIK